jgi:hypothetical protein
MADTVRADTVRGDTVVGAVSDAAGKGVPAGVAGQGERDNTVRQDSHCCGNHGV